MSSTSRRKRHNKNAECNSFENMPKVKYLETPVTNDNGIREEVREITCYHSVHNLLIARSLSANMRSKYAQRI